MIKTINILGTPYRYRENDLSNPDLVPNDGLCSVYDKEMVVRKKELMDGATESGRQYRYEHVLRHEIIHAVSEETGAKYGENEDLVDWIAHIIPIVNKVFEEIKELGD